MESRSCSTTPSSTAGMAQSNNKQDSDKVVKKTEPRSSDSCDEIVDSARNEDPNSDSKTDVANDNGEDDGEDDGDSDSGEYVPFERLSEDLQAILLYRKALEILSRDRT